MEYTAVLSICVPIYNRKVYLERMLARFLEDKILFEKEVHLYISDNCSTEDIKGVVDNFISQGLRITYHCNRVNLGMDGNFINCFNHACGKYVWLLGSDDIPRKGFIRELLHLLTNKEYGLLHLSERSIKNDGEIIEYKNCNLFLEEINVWITFISGNIVMTDNIHHIEFEKYSGSYISQVPAYLYSAVSSEQNAILYSEHFFDIETDNANNGGYNLFKVFVDNLFFIFQHYVDNGSISRRSFNQIKHLEYKDWLVKYVVDYLILRNSIHKNVDITNSWSILRRHYGRYPYFYYYTLVTFIKKVFRFIIKKI